MRAEQQTEKNTPVFYYNPTKVNILADRAYIDAIYSTHASSV